MLVTVLALAMFLLAEVAALLWFLVSLDPCSSDPGCLVPSLAAPAARALAAGVLVFLHVALATRLRPRILVISTGIPALALVALHLAVGISPGVPAVVAGAAVLDLFLWWRGPRAARVRVAALVAAAWTMVVLLALSIHPLGFVHMNRFGLVSHEPDSTEVKTYEQQIAMGVKDPDYPICRFEYNSLGYRDVEPDMGESDLDRILIVGDSFVWGDGIPDLAGTIGACLRRELENHAPGRYEVMAAGWRGNNLWGYTSTVAALAPVWRPDLVIVLYLGGADLDPLDPQRLVDALPAWPPARNLLRNLRLLHHVYRVVEGARSDQRGRPEDPGLASSCFERIRGVARDVGAEVLVLNFDPHIEDPPIPGLQWLIPSRALLSPGGKANALWYGWDQHPKPALNRALGRLLADHVLRDPRQDMAP